MELWIRTQDKECLMKVDRIDISDNNIIMANGFEIWLGAYKSKERALEVLDEIQNIFKPPLIIQKTEGFITTADRSMHIINPTYGDIKEMSIAVYEMPKE